MRLYVLIKTTINNIFVTVLDKFDKVLLVKSAGMLGFLGPRRPTPYASEAVGKKIAAALDRIYDGKIEVEIILISRFDKRTKFVLRGLKHSRYVNVVNITEKIAVAHNGCKLRKARRT